ncbi:uncharacterized protein gdrd [Drosophila pseudoobscura]|uniref:Uncharacterized protein gdrd n=1 Tax=Drosophila pseudoobscura pseudoobscura TaxID=46245 RepID=A0A6I8V0D4_DROPS|nr:uncharacterized protein LOC6900373 [Drosophila pseudoobscura]
MSDKPSEESLSKVLFKDVQFEEGSDSDVDLALGAPGTRKRTEQAREFDQIMTGIQERMARVMSRVSLSCTMINQLHRDLKAKLPGKLGDEDEAKEAGGDGEFQNTDFDNVALEKITEGPLPLQITEEILTEEGEDMQL